MMSAMNEMLSIAEIRARCASEWVLLEDPQVGPDQGVTAGRLLAHHPDREALYRDAQRLHPRHAAILFAGELPENAVVILLASA